MLDKPLINVNLRDLKELISEKIPERKTIEYKRDMYLFDHPEEMVKNKNREEFLKDISSFANTVGGHLIIGMDAKDGIPIAIPGVTFDKSIDDEKLRLHQLADKWIEPRIYFEIDAIPIEDDSNKHVLIIRIQQSLISPHRVVYQGNFGQFYARHSNGVFPMDTSQLRQAFTLSETIFDRIKRFRKERVDKILNDETPIIMGKGAKFILHLIPLESFATHISFDAKTLEAANFANSPAPLRTGSRNANINFDGIVYWVARFSGQKTQSYVQLFRNGAIEVVENEITSRNKSDTLDYLDIDLIEKGSYTRFPEYLNCFKRLGMHPPIWYFITLTGVKGSIVSSASGISDPIDRDILYIPEVRIDDLSDEQFIIDPQTILAPSINMIWNAAGIRSSPNFINK